MAETPDSLELQLNTRQLELARVTLAQQQEDLAELLEDRKTIPDSTEVLLRKQQIVLAQAELARAEEALVELLEEQASTPDPLEVALAEQKIVAGQVRLATAKEELAAAVITAPIAGYVAEISAEPGDTVEARAAIMELVDPTVVEIDGIVDEIDVLLVQVGTAAEVSLDALPGVTLDGVVTEIADEAQNQQGVITFPIRIRMEVPEGIRPRGGLSAVANIVLREERNVLLVPQQALYGSFDQPVVRVMTDGGVSEIPVELGSSDDFWVSVKAGVSEGRPDSPGVGGHRYQRVQLPQPAAGDGRQRWRRVQRRRWKKVGAILASDGKRKVALQIRWYTGNADCRVGSRTDPAVKQTT